MDVLYISGSPRRMSNTDILLEAVRSRTGGEMLKLSEYEIGPCKACWACQRTGNCIIDDDMSNVIIPELLKADAIVIGSPVFFNNVSSQLKAFIDRTWCIKGGLVNKVGGAVAVGRKYGIESAITAITAFYLKHNMIPANRGVCGIAYEAGNIVHDREAMQAAMVLGERIKELGAVPGSHE